MIGPIVTIDDVRTALGSWLLSEPTLTASQVKQQIKAARELAKIVECNLKLHDLTERGFSINYFCPQLRKEIRAVLDEMDSVSAGTETTIQRRNENLSVEQEESCQKHSMSN